VTRYGAITAQTTSSTQATTVRDASLQDNKDPKPRVGLTFSALYDASGGRWPNWAMRAGDTVTIRNLPPTSSTTIDRIRTFRVSETSYDVDTDTIAPTPEESLPTLDFLIARNAAGVR
jgi:hypothetical protein